jgi:hypothetical protein
VFVIDPATHSVQDATYDAAEYSPAAHAVQVVPPTEAPVSVVDPAWHATQNDLPSAL